ncbi:TPA: sugar nucleotide-binding protein [Burkholderia multivorans]|nr:sugar nucleotide-binding protein [Burkholderia multivorans]
MCCMTTDQLRALTWPHAFASVTTHVNAEDRTYDQSAKWSCAHTALYRLTSMGQTPWLGFAEAIFAAQDCANKPSSGRSDAGSYRSSACRRANFWLSKEKLTSMVRLRVPDCRLQLEFRVALQSW